ncbi:MAG: HDIG domain-containing protein [Deltaproteobacteria bacterium]|nr:HDIG domain-containing protein [Deltaproteobacteria bacterium]
MDRAEAWELFTSRIQDEYLIKHSLATEAIMRALAEKLGQDVELWGITGLLHDLDFPETKDDPQRHGLVSAELLEDKLPPEAITAIKRHNAEALGLKRESVFDLCLTAAETITGLVVATTLVYPDKKLKSVKPKSVTKRMKEKAFAAKVNRDHIRLCEEFEVPLPEFAALSVEAMRGISDELGL